jgi:outer membrane receptor protein involved in Fe transport
MLKALMIRSTFIALACSLSFIAFAMADPKQLDIPPGGLIPALEALSKQAAIEIVYQPDQLRSFRTKGVKGTYEPKDAVRLLIKGMPLDLRTDSSGAMVIAPTRASTNSTTSSTSSAVGAEPTKEGKNNSSGGFLVAQADQGQTTGTAAVERSGEQPAKLQEVVVTAQKREERLQNVPISVSVLTGTQLENPTVPSVSGALNTVPAVAINQDYTGAGPVVTVRGVSIGQTVFAGSSPVAYYIDSAPFGLVRSAVAPDQNPYDLERIEILKGPQGTLYGASALNGVVRIITSDADPNHFDFKARGMISNTDGGGNNYQGDMAVNVPLIDGKLAARAVVGYEDNSGWIDTPIQKGINDEILRNFRLKINAQPTDDLSIRLSYWGTRDNWGGPSNGNDDYKNTSLNAQPIQTDFDAYGVRVGYDFSGYSLSSVTSYLKFQNDTTFDFTSLLGFPFLLFTGLGSKVASEELLLNSPTIGTWRWSIGGMYRWGKESLYQFQPPYPPGASFFEEEYDTSKSYAFFGEVTRLFLEGRLEATVGLRQFEDHVNQQGRLLPTDPFIDSDGRFHATTPRAVLTWHQTPDLMFYGSYSQGFRSGFPQDVAAATTNIPAVNADKLYNYEIGTKGNLLDGKLAFELATYYMDWKDVQQTLQVPYQNIYVTAVINGQSASGAGVDLSVTTQPLTGLLLGATFSWNNLHTDADIYSSGVVLFHEGDRLNYSPERTTSGWFAYSFPFGSGWTGRFSGSVNYTSAQGYTVNPGGPVVIADHGDPLTISRFELAINSPAHWSATLFVDNANNERGALSRALDTPDLYTRIRPRTFGLELEYHFK